MDLRAKLIMNHLEHSESYSQVPFFAHLSPESISALQDNRFTVEQIELHENQFEMRVPILSWPGMHDDATALAEMLGETTGTTIGVLTDEAFQKLLFSLLLKNEVEEGTAGAMRQAISQRLIGTPFESVHHDVLTEALNGPLQEYYRRKNSVFTNGNLSQTAADSAVPISDHQQWVVANLRLNNAELPNLQKRIIRFVSIFHDWGKIVLARNGQHPEISAAMARTVLLLLHQQDRELYPLPFIEQVCWSISIHHVIERTFQPLKNQELSLLSVNPSTDATTLDGVSMSVRMGEIERWFLAQSKDTSIEQPALVMQRKQTLDFLHYLQVLAGNQLALLATEQQVEVGSVERQQFIRLQQQRLEATQRMISELFALYRNPDPEKVRTLTGLILLIEADLVATDRPVDEVNNRLNQLKIILQGLLALSRTNNVDGG